MKYIVCNSFIFILVFLLSFETGVRQTSSVQDQSPSNTDQSKEYPGQAYEFVFTKETKLSYNNGSDKIRRQ